MNYTFHKAAARELNESIDFYEKRKPGLGHEFSKEVHKSINRFLKNPRSNPLVSRSCRRCLIRRFPYGIIYLVSDDEVVIIAVMQLNRKPDYWKERLDDA